MCNTAALTTTEAQPPSLVTARGVHIKGVDSYKSLGCIIATSGPTQSRVNMAHDLQERSAGIFNFFDKNISIQQGFRCFDAVVTPAACFGAHHKVIYKEHLNMLHVALMKLLWALLVM